MGTFILRHGIVSKLLISAAFYEMEPAFERIHKEATAAHKKIEADLIKLKEGKCAKCVERGIRKKELEMVKAHATLFSRVVMGHRPGADPTLDYSPSPDFEPYDFSGMKQYILEHFDELGSDQKALESVDTVVVFVILEDPRTGAVNHIKLEV